VFPAVLTPAQISAQYTAAGYPVSPHRHGHRRHVPTRPTGR
jgi:hypothetical protein